MLGGEGALEHVRGIGNTQSSHLNVQGLTGRRTMATRVQLAFIPGCAGGLGCFIPMWQLCTAPGLNLGGLLPPAPTWSPSTGGHTGGSAAGRQGP